MSIAIFTFCSCLRGSCIFNADFLLSRCISNPRGAVIVRVLVYVSPCFEDQLRVSPHSVPFP